MASGLPLPTHPASGSWMEQTFEDSPFGSDIENSAFALPGQVSFCVMFFVSPVRIEDNTSDVLGFADDTTN